MKIQFLAVLAILALASACRADSSPASTAITSAPSAPEATVTLTDDPVGAAIMPDLAKPEFTGTLNGIVMYSGSISGPELPCTEAELRHKDISAAAGTQFVIFEHGLPPGLAPDAQEPSVVALCSGQIHASGGGFVISASNHLVLISRVLRPSPWNYAYGPADRVSAGTIAGNPAVLTRSVLADGRGGSYLTFVQKQPDGYLVTELDGPNAPISELIKVAEELTK